MGLKASLKTKLITISHNRLTGEVPLSLLPQTQLNIEMEGNLIDKMDERFCDNLGWMDGNVRTYNCDAIMCPPHSYSPYGRQNTTESNCEKCANKIDSTPFWGSTTCDVSMDERMVLELFYNALDG